MLSISEIIGGDSNDSTNSDADGDSQDASESDELREMCESLGADYDHASAYVDTHGKKDDLIDFARAIEDDDETMAVHEAYRRMNDVHRIILNWLRNDSRSFTEFTGGFYGDSDDPEPGEYNYVQQQVRALENGNLIFYRALFPAPQEQYWDTEPVAWHEFENLRYDTDSDNQVDSHIYVAESWAEEYSGFTLEVNGEERPRPPSNDEVEELRSDGGSSDSNESGGSSVAYDNAPFDPDEFTNDELKDELESVDYDEEQLRHALNMEKQSDRPRKGAKNALRDAIDALEESDEEQSEISDAGKAGQVNSGAGDDVPPEVLADLLEAGMTQERITEIGPDKITKLLDAGMDSQGIVDFYA